MSDIDDPTTAEALWLLSEDGKAAREANRADRVARHRAELAQLHASAKADTAASIERLLRDGGGPASIDEIDEIIAGDQLDAAADSQPSKLGAFDAWLLDHQLWEQRAHELLDAHADNELAAVYEGFKRAARTLDRGFGNAHALVGHAVERVAEFSIGGDR